MSKRSRDHTQPAALASFADLLSSVGPLDRVSGSAQVPNGGVLHHYKTRIQTKRLTLANLDRPRPGQPAGSNAERQVRRRNRRIDSARGSELCDPPLRPSRPSREQNRACLISSRTTFKALLPVHSLWLQYIQALLHLKVSNDGNADHSRTEQPDKRYSRSGVASSSVNTEFDRSLMTSAMAKADLTGAYVRVKRAVNPALVGLTGIVCLETEGSLVLAQDNPSHSCKKHGRETVVLPKRNAVFTICITLPTGEKSSEASMQALELDLFGNQMCQNFPARANRKHKARKTVDL